MKKIKIKWSQLSQSNRFWIDVIFSTCFVFSVMFAISQFSGAKMFDLFDPIKQAFGDMEMTDIAFSHLQERPKADTHIILVNIASRSRFEIGMMLDSISQHQPAVIGIDAFFDKPSEYDSLGDFVLATALERVENLVMASKWIIDDDPNTLHRIEYSWPLFMPDGVQPGIVNLETGTGQKEDLKMCRNFPTRATFDNSDETIEHAFGVQLASYIAPQKVEKFLKRGNDLEVVNYRGNIMDGGDTKFGNLFFALDDTDVLESNYIPELIKDKIVIFCYLGRYLGDQEALEDKFFTPLNKKYTGRAFPDMFGGVIHANIVAMILNEDYINKPNNVEYFILTLLIAFGNVIVFTWLYKKIPKWYDGTSKFIQAFELMLLVFLMIWALEIFNIKFELTRILIFVALVGDLTSVYFGLVKNLFTKRGRKELFENNKNRHNY